MGLVKAPGWARAQKSTEGNVWNRYAYLLGIFCQLEREVLEIDIHLLKNWLKWKPASSQKLGFAG